VGGELTYAPTVLATSLDPYSALGGTAQTGPEELAIYGSLLRFDEKTGTFEGEVAQGITPNADASEWTLKLRPEAKFGNGDPVDAAAVKASIERYIDPKGTSRIKGEGKYIKSMEVVDPLTLKFVLDAPWGFFPLELSAGGGAVGAMGMVQNVKVLNQVGVSAFSQNPAGGAAGPYEVESWNAPQQVVLKAKKDWWGGPVCIQKLTFVGLTNAQARVDGMASGDVQMSTLSRDPVLIAKTIKEYPYASTVDQGNSMVEFNVTNPELSDLRVRQAIAAAIDPKVISNRAFGGQALAGSGLVYPVEEAGITKGTQGLPYDPAKAKQLVAQLKGEGFKLTFEMLAGSSPASNVQAAIAIKSLLDAAGFSITVTPIDTAQAISRVYSTRNFDMWLGGQVGPLATEFASLFRFNSQNLANPYGFKDPAFDATLVPLRAAKTTSELLAAMNGVQQEWNKSIPAVAYTSDQAVLVWAKNVHGLYFTRGITPYFNKAYITK